MSLHANAAKSRRLDPVSSAAAVATPAEVRSSAIPVIFSNTLGLFTPSSAAFSPGHTAVLFVSPWGYEELCARKFWRLLADDLAEAGIPSLRFDYPGTGDALDLHDASAGIGIWHDSTVAAARTLRDISGATRLILIGQGIGASLAWEAAGDIGNVSGLALLAPVISGRTWLRELSVWNSLTEKMADEKQGSGRGLTISGLNIPEEIVAGIRGIKLENTAVSTDPRYFVLARGDRPTETQFAAYLERSGGRVETAPFEDYDRFVGNLMFSTPPRGALQEVKQWAVSVAEQTPAEKAVNRRTGISLPDYIGKSQKGDGFVETPVRFGENNRLYGILCEPAAARRGAMVLMLTTSYERMSGWGRIAADTARSLARAGVPSLRFDAANVADSPANADAPDQVVYSAAQLADVDAAVAFLKSRDEGPVVVAGRCSGAYLSFLAAVRRDYFPAVVAANIYIFHLDSSQSIDEIMRFVPTPMKNYWSKILRPSTWRRILSGEVSLKYGFINLSKRMWKSGLALVEPLSRSFPSLFEDQRAVDAAFQRIAAHGTELSLMYSEDDAGLANFANQFGADGYKLRRYPNVSFTLIPGADHGLTTEGAREAYLGEILKMALRFAPKAG
jgi:alpha-beta hydrolase superfamily lysophospholipase